MELNSDVWSKITEFLAIQCENETKSKKGDVWLEYGRLFKDLRRISKRCRSGVIAYQGKLLKVWFNQHFHRSLDKVNRRIHDYGKILSIHLSQLNYPNNVPCPYRFGCLFSFKKYNVKPFTSLYTKNIVNTVSIQKRRDFWSKLFPDVPEPQQTFPQLPRGETYEGNVIFDTLLSGIRCQEHHIDIQSEVHISTRYDNGKRHGPTVIHFPQRDITYIFIYEIDILMISAKKRSQGIRFYVHGTPKDPLVLSYTRSLQSSLGSVLSSL